MKEREKMQKMGYNADISLPPNYPDIKYGLRRR